MARLLILMLLLTALGGSSVAQAQSQDPADQPFVAGEPLNLSSNARTYGGFRFAEMPGPSTPWEAATLLNRSLCKGQKSSSNSTAGSVTNIGFELGARLVSLQAVPGLWRRTRAIR